MKKLHIFVLRPDLTDNDPEQLSEVGELSSVAATYSKDIKQLSSPKSGVVLLHFESSLDRERTNITSSLEENLFEINEHINSLNSTNKNKTEDDIKNKTSLNINSVIQIDDTITYKNKYYVPRLTFTLKTSVYPDDYQITFYYTNKSLIDNYDVADIKIIPPVKKLDLLFGDYNVLNNEIREEGEKLLVSELNSISANDPFTTIKTIDLDTVFGSNKVPLRWKAVINGVVRDKETLNNKIKEYIFDQNNTSKPTLEWRKKIPSLYVNNVTYIIPMWENIAITSLNNPENSINSSSMNVGKLIDKAKAALPDIDSVALNGNLELLHVSYKHLILATINVSKNSSNESIANKYKDYIPVSTDSPDYGSMSVNTREFFVFLDNLLKYSDNTINMIIPSTVNKIIKDGNAYMESVLHGVSYMVYMHENVFRR